MKSQKIFSVHHNHKFSHRCFDSRYKVYNEEVYNSAVAGTESSCHFVATCPFCSSFPCLLSRLVPPMQTAVIQGMMMMKAVGKPEWVLRPRSQLQLKWRSLWSTLNFNLKSVTEEWRQSRENGTSIRIVLGLNTLKRQQSSDIGFRAFHIGEHFAMSFISSLFLLFSFPFSVSLLFFPLLAFLPYLSFFLAFSLSSSWTPKW